MAFALCKLSARAAVRADLQEIMGMGNEIERSVHLFSQHKASIHYCNAEVPAFADSAQAKVRAQCAMMQGTLNSRGR